MDFKLIGLLECLDFVIKLLKLKILNLELNELEIHGKFDLIQDKRNGNQML